MHPPSRPVEPVRGCGVPGVWGTGGGAVMVVLPVVWVRVHFFHGFTVFLRESPFLTKFTFFRHSEGTVRSSSGHSEVVEWSQLCHRVVSSSGVIIGVLFVSF